MRPRIWSPCDATKTSKSLSPRITIHLIGSHFMIFGVTSQNDTQMQVNKIQQRFSASQHQRLHLAFGLLRGKKSVVKIPAKPH